MLASIAPRTGMAVSDKAADLEGRPPQPCEPRLGFGLCFSTHALVRYIERHVDANAVEMLRVQGLDDHRILGRLKVPYAAELDAFVTRAAHAYDNCCTMTRDGMF